MAGMHQQNRLSRYATPDRARRWSRREIIARGTALGLSAPAIAGLLARGGPAAARQDTPLLTLNHDKGPWQENLTTMGERAAEETGVGFEPVPFPDTTTYQQVIKSSLPTDEAPDLFTWWSGYRIEDLVQEGALADVSAVWEKEIAAGNLPESLAAAFTFDDTQWAVPMHLSYWPVFYSKKAFNENEIEPPTTWVELMTAADTLKAAGVIPFFATVTDRWPAFIWFEELVIRTDPEFYVELTQGNRSYTDPLMMEVMETWKGMLDNEYFTPLDVNMFDEGGPALASGEVAMLPLGTWFNLQLMETGMEPGTNYGAFILPNVNPDLNENVLIVETGALATPANAENPEAVTEIFDWWFTPEVQTTWANLLGDVPANPKAESDNPLLQELGQTIVDGDYRLLQRYWEASPPQIVEAAVDELARFMLNPDEAESVLEAIERIAQTEWEKRG